MKKRFVIIALVLCLMMAVFAPVIAQAQDELTVVSSGAEADFPARLVFNLSARSNFVITDIRLCYSIERTSFADVFVEAVVDFVPDSTVDVSWRLEMVMAGGLPPGSSVDYWWKITDAGGGRIETEPVRVRFDDTRYEWSSLTEGQLTLYCYQDDAAFVAELMDSALSALARLAADTGAELDKPAQLYIYANSSDLQGAMIHPQEWTGGVAYTRHGIIAIGIAPTNISWGKRAIAHELAHLVVHQMTLNPYNDLPTWLDEGLAMYAEGEQETAFADYLEEAIDSDSLISVQSLCSPFSAYSNIATLGYAESYSLAAYLISSYGQVKMLELLNTFKEGSGYDAALEAVYGFDMDTLDSLWRDYVAD
ncbi:MAG TPA: peptidase MA family metallohydrolase [Dehalococcoidales bacterium]|nr:peptidase MA family metallohydrolase [Dehalococcoidales bacterium]